LKEAFGQLGAGQQGGFGLWLVDSVSGWLFYLKTLFWGMGPILLALGGVGVLRRFYLSIKAHDRQSILLLSFPVIYYLAMGATRHYFARYAIPLVPFLALFAAEEIEVVARWLGAGRLRRQQVYAALLIVGALTMPLLASIRHDILLTRTDTRTLAKEWIEANVPANARIAVDWPVHGPPLSTAEIAVPRSTNVYDVQAIGGTGLADHSLEWYREQGFDYLIASSHISSSCSNPKPMS
jgi:hypothetical protein